MKETFSNKEEALKEVDEISDIIEKSIVFR